MKITSDVVNQAKYRWQACDETFLKHRDEDPPVPIRRLCAQVTEYRGVQEPSKFVWLCHDFMRQLDAVLNEAVRAGVLA